MTLRSSGLQYNSRDDDGAGLMTVKTTYQYMTSLGVSEVWSVDGKESLQ